ncbi:NlpC/P60 family protein [Alteribacillus sp. HJP-4]|uniref:NlpC/P60 family protein n=1 Tax=Alteribacillus sp. HJP-4 TaxID=2775394 RepID=UPI0035CD2768
MKKIPLICIAALLLITAPNIGYAENEDDYSGDERVNRTSFIDVPGDYWSADSIELMRTKEIFNGYDDGTFKPLNDVTWMQTIITAVRMLDLEDRAFAVDPSVSINMPGAGSYFYSDRNDWAKGYVAVALEEGIVKENEYVGGNASAERMWVTKVLVRALNLEREALSTNESTTFTDDSEIIEEERGYAAVANKYGIVTGKKDGSFQPDAHITRAQMATVMDRAHQKYTEWNDPENAFTTNILSKDAGALVDKVIKTGESYQGAPYLFGADPGQTEEFDCSSFTKRIFEEHGIELPRVSRNQIEAGLPVPELYLTRGDLVFFDTDVDGIINHVAIYINENSLLHATRTLGVNYTEYTSYWRNAFVGAVRVVEDE